MLKTVIFDMDGVLVDTEPVHYYAFMRHFKELSISISDEVYATFTGNSTKNVYEKIKNEFGLSEDVEELIQRKRRLFNEAFDTKKDLYLIEGVEKIIKELFASDIQLIVASSSAKVTIDRVFKRFDLYTYFSHVVSGEDFPQSKPHPAIFERACELSGHKKQECVVIEDAFNGVQAAKKAGLYCIGYRSQNSKMQDLSQADFILSHFSELNLSGLISLLSERNRGIYESN